ncbi:MAG TPA: GlsB/YeaQ/YmgE family stress response membrane protein [Caulobacteraceae bacterium]|nr:GlsB/YeaQ/YmgE family stress response membrane protein [Caulobacteraceae bacterium]
MGIIAWLVLGLIAGFIASKIVNHTGSGVIMDIVLGVVGAFVGGFVFSFFGAAGVTGFNIYSALVAIVGAVVVLFLYHLIAGRRRI